MKQKAKPEPRKFKLSGRFHIVRDDEGVFLGRYCISAGPIFPLNGDYGLAPDESVEVTLEAKEATK